MIQAFHLYAKQILSLEGFQVSRLPGKTYRSLLTAYEELLEHEVVMIEGIVKLAKGLTGGRLILDDTTNPKYGLKPWARKMKILGTSGYAHGYKILLFLYEGPWGRLPLGFALWHKQSPSVNELVLAGLSELRNRFHFKPGVVLADGAFSSDKLLKRLEDYGWPCVMRLKNNRKLCNRPILKQIPRGYGSAQGRLKNGAKLKVFRRKNRLYGCNRMLWTMENVVALYTKRWKVEEVFRALKQTVRLNGCQQHSIRAQTVYLILCLLLFTSLEMHPGHSVYSAAHTVISGQQQLEDLLYDSPFTPF